MKIMPVSSQKILINIFLTEQDIYNCTRINGLSQILPNNAICDEIS